MTQILGIELDDLDPMQVLLGAPDDYEYAVLACPGPGEVRTIDGWARRIGVHGSTHIVLEAVRLMAMARPGVPHLVLLPDGGAIQFLQYKERKIDAEKLYVGA